jgi:hypothetical protein
MAGLHAKLHIESSRAAATGSRHSREGDNADFGVRDECWWLWYEQEALFQGIQITFVGLHGRLDSKCSMVTVKLGLEQCVT